MAGPPQLSEPRVSQGTAVAPADLSAGEAVAAAGAAIASAVGETAASGLRDEAGQQRTDFFKLLNEGVDPNDPVLSNNPNSQGVISLDVDTILQSAVQPRDGDTIELEAFSGELAQVKRGVEQGITPVRALEINVEAITRRYIDRFPGLSRQFQSIAQTALGTQNNLLAATMRTIDDLSRASSSVTEKEDAFLKEMAKINPLVMSPVKSVSDRALANASATARFREQADVITAANDLAAARGDLTIQGSLVADSLTTASNLALSNWEMAMESAMPQRLQGLGIAAVSSNVGLLSDAERVTGALYLENAKNAELMALDQISINFELNGAQQAALDNRKETLAALYDNTIEGWNLGKLNEQLDATTNIMTQANVREFEGALGKEALILERILKHFPPGSSLHNHLFNDFSQQQLGPKFAEFAGLMSLNDILRQAGEDPSTPINKDAKAVFNRANVDALRTVIMTPNAPGVASADPAKMLRTFDLEFIDAGPSEKKDMLELIGTPEFGEFFSTTDLETREAMQSLARKTANFGSKMLNRLGLEALTDIGEPLMRRQWGIKTVDEGKFRAVKPGEKPRGPIMTGDIVKFTVDDRGLKVGPKSVAELDALGVDTSPENMQRIQQMVASWNAKLITNINSYARSMAVLDPAGDRKGYIELALRQVITEEEPDADVQPTE